MQQIGKVLENPCSNNFLNNVDRMALLCLYTSLTCSDSCTGNFHAFFDAHGEFLSKNQSSQALYHSFSWSIDFYVNGVSEWLQWSCKFGQRQKYFTGQTCIRLFQLHQLSPWIGNKEILPYQVFVCRMSHQLEEKWCICRSHLNGATNAMFRALFWRPNVLILTLALVLFAFERHTKIKQIFKISENTHRNNFSD